MKCERNCPGTIEDGYCDTCGMAPLAGSSGATSGGTGSSGGAATGAPSTGGNNGNVRNGTGASQRGTGATSPARSLGANENGLRQFGQKPSVRPG